MSEAELLCRPPVASVFSEDGFALGKDTYVEAGHSILYRAASGCSCACTSAMQRKAGLGDWQTAL